MLFETAALGTIAKQLGVSRTTVHRLVEGGGGLKEERFLSMAAVRAALIPYAAGRQPATIRES